MIRHLSQNHSVTVASLAHTEQELKPFLDSGELGPVPALAAQCGTDPAGYLAEGPVLKRMDVYMTPGAAADVFQALRALPGAALGILRYDKVGSESFSTLPAEVRAKAREKQLLIITKANVDEFSANLKATLGK